MPVAANSIKSSQEDADVEIVVVSDTVRQRRARTPSANDSSSSSSNLSQTTLEVKQQKPTPEESQQSQVLPDLLLPPQTFRLAESSSLFSQISKHPRPRIESQTTATEAVTAAAENAAAAAAATNNEAQVVEVIERNIRNDKMSVQNIEFEPHVGEIVHTVNILESVEPFVPEFVETVQIVDLSEDSDSSSVRIDEIKRSRSKRSLCDSPKVTASTEDLEVELRTAPLNTSTPILRVEKQRISFEEKRKRIENERDILRDSEEEDDDVQEREGVAQKDQEVMGPPRTKRWRHLPMHLPGEAVQLPEVRDSFYTEDKEANFDVEPLVFSDDEEIPRFSMEMTPTFDSDSDTVNCCGFS